MKTLFFDVDDTLYDRSDSFVSAFGEFFAEPVCDAYAAYVTCSKRNNEIFMAAQRGEITMDEMYIYRYCRGFEDVGVKLTPEEALAFERVYRAYQKAVKCSPVITQALQECGREKHLGIITNGTPLNQREKIAALGIEPYFVPELIIVSGEVKIDKPDERIFALAEERSGVAKDDLVYIGDSFSFDILPAAKCGWQSVWFNRRKVTPPEAVPAGCIIVNTERELAALLAEM